MSYNLDPISADCYPDTTILINKFNIHDQSQLDEIEVVLVSVRAAEWETSPKNNTFDFEHYKAIHAHLFSELYAWAGHLRTVDISKKGTQFCPAKDIEDLSDKIFSRLKSQKCFHDLSHEDFISAIVDFYCSTNFLHPFPEGNGRTQRLFLSQLVRAAGFDLNFSEIDGDLLVYATIQSAQGITDLLQKIFHDAIR